MTLMMRRLRSLSHLQTLVKLDHEGITCNQKTAHLSLCLLFKNVFSLVFFFLFLLAADGIKLRATKNETNGTVKPAETNPVSNTDKFLVIG